MTVGEGIEIAQRIRPPEGGVKIQFRELCRHRCGGVILWWRHYPKNPGRSYKKDYRFECCHVCAERIWSCRGLWPGAVKGDCEHG